MGTSTSNNGQNGRTPLVPSWLEDDADDNSNIPPQADPERFRNPRGNLTKYINSEGKSKDYLRSATSEYIKKSIGGSRNATIRLGAGRASTTKLVNILSYISKYGVENTGIKFQLGDLVGKNAKDFFIDIIDFVCPDGGIIDEGIARSSYIEAIEDIPELSNRNIEELSEQELLVFIKIYMTNVVEQRLINDIGNKVVSLPNDLNIVETLQDQIKDYIYGAISDSIINLNVEIKNIESEDVSKIVDLMYEQAYSILASVEE